MMKADIALKLNKETYCMNMVMRSFLSIIVWLCFICLTISIQAQETTTPPQQSQPQNQQPSQQPTQQPTQQQSQPAKKTNARPASAASKSTEPYARATAAEMAGKCVTLVTEEGAIEIELLAEAAPETVRNFLNLVAIGAYDTTTFNRVVPDFVIQGGDLSTHAKFDVQLSERARRTIPDEPNYVKHVRGVVSMARAAAPNSATTNFFVLVGDAPHLDGTFAAFGTVRSGMDVVDRINKAPVEFEKPKKPVHITSTRIRDCTPTPTPQAATP